jgi:acyl carrier protein
MRDPIYLFDISTGTLGDRDREKNFNNPRSNEQRPKTGWDSLRILSDIDAISDEFGDTFLLEQLR